MSVKAPATHPLADLYRARALDPVIELARSLARDAVARPQHHTRATAAEIEELSNFRLLVGKHPNWPDSSQRSFASTKLFARMCQSFAGLRLAAIQMTRSSERGGAPGGRRALAEAAERVRATVQPLEGAALSAVAEVHSTMMRRAVSVISSKRVAAAFGMADLSIAAWPEGAFSPQFGYLCESMSQTLQLEKPLRQPAMSSLQRAAEHGSATLNAVCGRSLDDADDAAVADVAHSATAWAAALGEILAGLKVARAWQDPAYRSRLSLIERDVMPPHPSGEVDLEGTVKTSGAHFNPALGFTAFSTETMAGEICCCTGDLVCPTNTNGDCTLSDDCPTLTGSLIA